MFLPCYIPFFFTSALFDTLLLCILSSTLIRPCLFPFLILLKDVHFIL